MSNSRLLTVGDACEIAKKKRQAIIYYINQKRLPAFKLGWFYVIREDDLMAFLPTIKKPGRPRKSTPGAAAASAKKWIREENQKRKDFLNKPESPELNQLRQAIMTDYTARFNSGTDERIKQFQAMRPGHSVSPENILWVSASDISFEGTDYVAVYRTTDGNLTFDGFES